MFLAGNNVKNLISKDVNINWSRKNISGFERNFFDVSFSSLCDLNLELNEITLIEKDLFSNLKQLKKLNLSSNSIKKIEKGAFNKLKNLKELHLSKNSIETLSDNEFKNLKALEKLFIDNNQIKSLNINAFLNLKSLKKLSLEKNLIESIEGSIFSDLAGLEELYLNENQLQTIKANYFNGLANLKTLHLENNKIVSVDEDSFKGLANLKCLYLYNESLKEISPACISNMAALKKVWLFGTEITYILDTAKEYDSNQMLNEFNYKQILTFYEQEYENFKITFMDKSIRSIKAKENFKVIEKEFEWIDIHERLSVVIGQNGTGKSTLLEFISNSLNKHQESNEDNLYYVFKYFTSSFDELSLRQNSIFSIYNNELSRRFINNTSISSSEAKNIVYDSINDFSTILYFDYILLETNYTDLNLKDLNEFLADSKFKYRFSIEKINKRKQIQKQSLVYYDGLGISIEKYFDKDGIKLSPGEDLFLLILLWIFHAKILNLKPLNSIETKKRILLLDEPDAHMHPTLIKQFVDLLLSDNLRKLNLQIIMTTHNPITLSFIPIDNIFIMSPITVKPASNKGFSQTVQLLTQDLISLNQMFRIVFVEANDDKLFYEHIRNAMSDSNHLKITIPILFSCYGPLKMNNDDKITKRKLEKRKSDLIKNILKISETIISSLNHTEIDNELKLKIEEMEQFLNKYVEAKSKLFNSCKSEVQRIVNLLVSFADGKLDPKDFGGFISQDRIFGICDGDNELNERINNLFYLQQYSIENYILNPATLFLLLKILLPNCDQIRTIESKIQKEWPDFEINQNIFKHTDNHFIESYFQILIDELTKKLVEYVQRKINYEHIDRATQKLKKCQENLRDELIKLDEHITKLEKSDAKNNNKIMKASREMEEIRKKLESNMLEIKKFNDYCDMLRNLGDSEMDKKKNIKSLFEATKGELILEQREVVSFINFEKEKNDNNLINLKMEKFLLYIKGKFLDMIYKEIFVDLYNELVKFADLQNNYENSLSSLIILFVRNKKIDNCIMVPKEFYSIFEQLVHFNKQN